jgi:hypothetical protein
VCGIAGYTHFDRRPDPEVILRSIIALRHRGPDDLGTFESPDISLGSAHLKIIDLEGGDQPMQTEQGNCIIAFNGEIYNYRELRLELEGLGHGFRSRCDAEVAVRAFDEWDVDCFSIRKLMNGKLPRAFTSRRKEGVDIPARERLRGALRPLLCPLRLGGLVVMFFLGALSTCLRAQETVSTSVSNLILHDAPGRDDAVQVPGSEAVQLQSSANIAGTVRDALGAAVSGVRVTLVGQNNAVDRVVTADSKGAFTFAELVPGTYLVNITAVAGLEPFVASAVVVVLGVGERRELPIVGTRIPTTSTSVNVVATLTEIAQEQVREQEKQRELGFFPNYYSSYIWDAAPMTPKLKFKLSLRSTTDPVTFLVAAGLAGVEQRHNTFPGYGQGPEGYAKRFGAAYADTMVSKMVSRAILPTVLHQDPRYFYRGSGSIRSRILYALAAAVICRGDNGRLQPNYSQVLGNFAASGISNLYRAPGDRTASLTFRNGLIMTGSGAVENLLREFFSRKLTSNVPAFASGKP